MQVYASCGGRGEGYVVVESFFLGHGVSFRWRFATSEEQVELHAPSCDTAAARARAKALAEFLDAWEAEHGALTAEELAAAAEELGLHSPGRDD
jgi:hypothetical protein